MANEAVIVELGPDGGRPIDFTCTSGTAIAKGTILQLTEPRTASASSASGEPFAGIAAAAKSATDYSVTIAGYQTGIFTLMAADGSAISAGELVSLSGANVIKLATTAETVTGDVIGKALEDMAQNTTGNVQIGNAI